MSIVLGTITITKIYYYSLTGKTEALVKELGFDHELIKLNNIKPNDFRFDEDKLIIIGSPTYGRGVPPKYFKDILLQLRDLSGRKIGLFGSGNTIYGDDYCGALDVLEEILKVKNEIVFKYKFEGYPRKTQIEEFLAHVTKGG